MGAGDGHQREWWPRTLRAISDSARLSGRSPRRGTAPDKTLCFDFSFAFFPHNFLFPEKNGRKKQKNVYPTSVAHASLRANAFRANALQANALLYALAPSVG